jgi:hypothetical protein
MTLTDLAQLGPILSGIGLILGSAAAWATLFLFHRKSHSNQWVESFRRIYADFWTDEKVSRARRWIDNDREYTGLRAVLVEVLEKGNFDLSESEYNYIECLDRFLATMLRVTSFIGRNRHMTKEQEWLWFNMFQRYWIPRMYGRPELDAYVAKYWVMLYKVTHEEEASNTRARSIPRS